MSMPDYKAGKGKPMERADGTEYSKKHSLTNLFKQHVKTKVDLWPLFAFMSIAVGAVGVIAWWSFRKLEVQVVRSSNKERPLEWERARDTAYNTKWKLSDLWTGASDRRIPELDKLQDEMVEAKKSRPKEEKGHH